jgi:hypothetical protein
VSFSDGFTALGTATLTTSGGVTTASFSISTLTAGTHTITASYSGDGNFTGSSGSLTGGQTVTLPTITSLSPSSVEAGSNSFTLTARGSNFVPGATVEWTANGTTTPLATTFVSGSQLLANVPSSLVTAAGGASVAVREVVNGSAVTSNSANFSIVVSTGFPPMISSISPFSVQEGSSSFTLTVNGSLWVPGATVQWTMNGATTPLATIFVSSNQLLATVPSSLLTTAGTATVTVSEVLNGGFLTSNDAFLLITPVSPQPPLITSLSPSSVQAGSSCHEVGDLLSGRDPQDGPQLDGSRTTSLDA